MEQAPLDGPITVCTLMMLLYKYVPLKKIANRVPQVLKIGSAWKLKGKPFVVGINMVLQVPPEGPVLYINDV